MLSTIKTSYLRLIVLIGIPVILLFYFFINPLDSPYMPKCLFYQLTGLKCMGCGSQRMVHALLHGNFIEAFRVNALATLSLPLIAFLVWLEMFKNKHPKLYIKFFSLKFMWGSFIVLVGWMIARNLLNL